jgi:hypothetical protein
VQAFGDCVFMLSAVPICAHPLCGCVLSIRMRIIIVCIGAKQYELVRPVLEWFQSQPRNGHEITLTFVADKLAVLKQESALNVKVISCPFPNLIAQT